MIKKYSIGIDVGGTKISAVLMNDGKVIANNTLGTPQDTLDHFLIMVNAVIEPLIEKTKNDKAKISNIGMGLPGMIDEKRETVLHCPNLPLLDGVRLPTKFKNKFGYKIKIDNDARCFVRAEANLGAGKNFKNVYGVTIGTGIGGGWWVNNNMYSGAKGGGSEPGHMIIDHANSLDWEDVYHKITDKKPADLARKAYLGDVRSEQTFHELGLSFGACFANLVNLIAPEIIVIGGGVTESSDLFLDEARMAMEKLIVNPASKKTKIAKAKLGQLAGAIGASLLK